jgi:hypothetical protein
LKTLFSPNHNKRAGIRKIKAKKPLSPYKKSSFKDNWNSNLWINQKRSSLQGNSFQQDYFQRALQSEKNSSLLSKNQILPSNKPMKNLSNVVKKRLSSKICNKN